jgi:Patatin-like phospholipase
MSSPESAISSPALSSFINSSPAALLTLECDIVMKGGISSGVVYPFAVVELAKTYCFRNVGGTSAGAIAAVAKLRIQGLLESPSRATILRLAPKGVLICLGSGHFRL